MGGFLSLLGLSPVVGRYVGLIPGPVLGVVTLLLFGMVATAGIALDSILFSPDAETLRSESHRK